MKKLLLNIGAGKTILPEYINTDLRTGKGIDKILDLDKIPYPWKSNTFDEVRAWAILEHIDKPYEAILEVHRILKKGGLLHILVPHFSCGRALHPLHRTQWNANWFEYLDKNVKYEDGSLEKLELFDIETKIHFFKGIWIHNYIIEKLVNINKKTQLFYEDHLAWRFPAHEIEIKLTK